MGGEGGEEWAECPVGCGKRLLVKTMNFHVDACLRGRETTAGEEAVAATAAVATQNASVNVGAPSAHTERVQMVTCPVCQREVSTARINTHLDAGECGAPTASSDKDDDDGDDLANDDGEKKPPGLRVLEDFLTEEEEKELLRHLDANGGRLWRASTFSGSSHTQSWGYKVDWGARTSRPASEEADIPPWQRFIVERFQRAHPSLAAWKANQCNANEYVRSRGDFLRPHFDDRQFAGDIIVNVSLVSDCVMTFARPNSPVSFRVRLKRRSASIMSRASRWEFTHEIKHEDFCGERRVSINFRQVR